MIGILLPLFLLADKHERESRNIEINTDFKNDLSCYGFASFLYIFYMVMQINLLKERLRV